MIDFIKKQTTTTQINELERFFFLEKINFDICKNPVKNNKETQLAYLLDIAHKNAANYSFLKKFFKEKKVISGKIKKMADLFAGCGGLSLGMEKAGFEPVFVNEIEKTYIETYYFNHNLPIENYYIGDINTLILEIENYKSYISDLDLVCGGPPCQGFSMANRQRIVDDPRNNLYKAYLQFLQITKPKFFVIENVKGMSQKIDEILEDIKIFVGTEYDVHYALLNAKDFGIPQNRERFFIIGNRIGISSKIIFEDIKKEEIPFLFTLKDAIEYLPVLSPKSVRNNNDLESDEVGYTIQKYKYTHTQYYHYLNGEKEINHIFNHKNRFNNERDIEIFGRLPQGANSLHESIADIMPYSSRNHIFKDKYFKLNEDSPCKTITSHMKFDCNMYIHPWQSRGLSPREAARIQTFPDDYYFRGSQNSWYAQIGNAVPVQLAAIIGKHISKHL